MDIKSGIKGGEVMKVVYLEQMHQEDAEKVKGGTVVDIFGEPYIATKLWNNNGRLFVRLRDGEEEWKHSGSVVTLMDAKVEIAHKRTEVE